MTETNPTPTQPETPDTALWRAISGVVYSHCKDVQLPRGTNGLIDDLAALLNTRRAAVTAPRGDAERLAAMFTELYNCYTASKCAAAEKGEHDDYQHLKGMAQAYQDAAKRCQLFPVQQRNDGTPVTTVPTISDSARRAAEEIADRWFRGDLPIRAQVQSTTRIMLRILSEEVITKHFAAAPADNDAESLLSVAELRSVCCDAPTRTVTTDYNVCTACKEAYETTTTTEGARADGTGE